METRDVKKYCILDVSQREDFAAIMGTMLYNAPTKRRVEGESVDSILANYFTHRYHACVAIPETEPGETYRDWLPRAVGFMIYDMPSRETVRIKLLVCKKHYREFWVSLLHDLHRNKVKHIEFESGINDEEIWRRFLPKVPYVHIEKKFTTWRFSI